MPMFLEITQLFPSQEETKPSVHLPSFARHVRTGQGVGGTSESRRTRYTTGKLSLAGERIEGAV